MFIYGALIIPLLVTGYLLMFHRKDVKFWEPLVMFAAALICIVASKAISEGVQVHDTEYWGHLGIAIIHEEPYSYQDTCSREVCSGSGKNRSCTTQYYSCIQDVSRACYLAYPTRSDGGSGDKMNYGTYRISYAKYKQIDQRCKTNGHKFKQLHKDYYNRKNHGGEHRVYWDKDWKTSEPMVAEHSYENRVQAASSVFNYEEVSDEDVARYELYQYPDVSAGYEAPTIMDQFKNWKMDRYFRYMNADLGPKKKLRIWVLIYKNQPQTAAAMQEALWNGSNKNEFIYCIGVDNDYNIKWGQIITWSESHELKINARNFISTEMKVVSEESLLELGRWSTVNLGLDFVKKNWEDFDYLTVQPSTTAVVISYIITLLVSLGVAYWAVKNQFHDHGSYRRRR
ncbi:MAG: hypothetical protein ACTSX1_09085 [Candidatus Heimdallarchaeaceae archaeon]